MKIKRLILSIIIGLIYLLHSSVFAQSQIIDSLKEVVITQPNDTFKVKNYDEICWQLLHSDLNQALFYADSTIRLSKKIKYPLGEIKGISNKAGYYYLKGEFDKALELYIISDSISKEINYSKGEKSAMVNIANIHFQKGEYKKALAMHDKALKWSTIKKDTLSLIKTFLNKSAIYNGMGNFEKSITHSIKALDLLENPKFNNEKLLIGTGNNNLCACFIESKNSKKAIQYCKKAASLFKEIKYYSNLPSVLFNLGNAYSMENKMDTAITIVKEGFKYNPKGRSLYYGYAQLSRIYLKQNQIDSALHYSIKAYNQATSLNMANEKAISTIDIAKAYWMQHDYYTAYTFYKNGIDGLENLNGDQIQLSEAYKEFLILKSKIRKRISVEEMERYIELRDTIFSEKSIALLNEIETKYQVRQKEDSIRILQFKELSALEKFKKERTTKVLFLLGLVLSIVILVLLFRLYKKEQNISLMLNKNNERLIENNSQLIFDVEEYKNSNLQLSKDMKDYKESDSIFRLKNSFLALDNREKTKINLNNILYLESKDKKVYIYTKDKSVYYYWHKSLTAFSHLLPSDIFIKISQSNVVNIFEVTKKPNGKFILSNGKELKISRNYRSKVEKLFDDFIVK